MGAGGADAKQASNHASAQQLNRAGNSCAFTRENTWETTRRLCRPQNTLKMGETTQEAKGGTEGISPCVVARVGQRGGAVRGERRPGRARVRTCATTSSVNAAAKASAGAKASVSPVRCAVKSSDTRSRGRATTAGAAIAAIGGAPGPDTERLHCTGRIAAAVHSQSKSFV